MIPPDLYRAYLTTSYQVSGFHLIIQIGDHHPELDNLLKEHNSETWAFITAFNPNSQILSDEENLRRHQLLLEDLTGVLCFEGQGISTDPAWKPELSLLILGISHDEAIRTGRKYVQNAIVMGKRGDVAELVILV